MIGKLKEKKKVWLLIKAFLGIEGLVLLLFGLNVIFNDYTSFLVFHVQVWRLLLSTGTVSSMIIYALPIAITAIGAAYNENVGVINIGLEGIMLWGAWAGIYFTFITGNPWAGVFASIVFGLLNALIHAVWTITFKSEQIVTGVAINLFATGMTDVLTTLVWNPGRSPPLESDVAFKKINFYDSKIFGEFLSKIRFTNFIDKPGGKIFKYIPDPIDVLSGQTILFYLGILIIPIAHIFLFKTKWGLRMRVIGEHPQTAATAGIPVKKYQFIAVLISGGLAGLGGAILSVGIGTSFTVSIVQGRGFTALAAMIFGNWTVLGAVAATLFFGFFYALSIRMGVGFIYNFEVPNEFLQMMPYIVAIMALSGFIGKSRPPKAIGKPYDVSDE